MKNNKHILLISYVFPPHYGIGGRRWANHAVELTKLGYVVHVICARNPFNKQSLWTEMVQNNPNIIVYQISSMYPKTLVKFNLNFLDKILYRLFDIILPFLVKGSHLDRSVFWKRPLLKKAEGIIKEFQIKHVISTGGPFGVMYYTTLLKRKFNDIFILNDMRDPWTWGPNWGYPSLSKERMIYEKRREYEAMRDSDLISTPSEDLVNYLKSTYPEFNNKFIKIPHFFDPNEVCQLNKTRSSKIRFVLYGNIYHNIEDYIQMTAELFSKFKDKISLDVYTDKVQHKQTFERFGASNVSFFDLLPAKELFTRFKDYDFVFMLSPHYNINNISTKFYEIIHSRTPILQFSKYGLSAKFLQENKLGIHADLNELETVLRKLIDGSLNFEYNFTYDVSNYTVQEVVKDIAIKLDAGNEYCDYLACNKKSKQLLLTFDYELFLGERSGSALNCIIIPTTYLLSTLEKNGIKNAIFFVDTVYLYRLVDLANAEAKRDYELIIGQLTNILRKGHLIFPHIHAHWLDAVYLPKINQWDLKNKKLYRFHNVDYKMQEFLFEYSIDLIKKIQKLAEVDYNIDSYRAGGWCIQPFDDFKFFFEKYKIKNDFSVLKDFSLKNEESFYDFDNFPSKPIYKFSSDISIQNNSGFFKEYSITSIFISRNRNFLNRIWNKILYKMGYVNYGDGKAALRPEAIDEKISENEYQTSKSIEMVSIELLNKIKLNPYKEYFDNNKLIHFISHPKMITAHNLNCFDKLIKYVKSNYEIETDYKRMF